MFRIIFDPKVSRFVVQIMIWHLFWRDCYRAAPTGDGPPERITFGVWKDAVAWVNSIGLSMAYAEQQYRSLYKTVSPEAR